MHIVTLCRYWGPSWIVRKGTTFQHDPPAQSCPPRPWESENPAPCSDNEVEPCAGLGRLGHHPGHGQGLPELACAQSSGQFHSLCFLSASFSHVTIYSAAPAHPESLHVGLDCGCPIHLPKEKPGFDPNRALRRCSKPLAGKHPPWGHRKTCGWQYLSV